MCLYVQQQEGDRVSQAQAALTAIRAGDLDKAETIYCNVTGKKFMEHNRHAGNAWLIYCMPGIILSHVESIHCPKPGPRHNDDSVYYERKRQAAEKAYGGKWEVIYEY